MKFISEVRKLLYGLALLVLAGAALSAADLEVAAAVEKQQLYTGESIIFQIKVSGSENPKQPELKGFDDFDVEFTGGAVNSSEQRITINGRSFDNIFKGYIFQYTLTPRRVGELIVPSVEVNVEGRRLKTSAIRLLVKEPAETSDYKLRISLSETSCYVGEPVVLDLIWYIAGGAENVVFDFPLLEDDRFSVEEVPLVRDRDAKYFSLSVNGKETIFEQPASKKRYQGRDYTTVSFRRFLIPRVSGSLSIGKAFVNFRGVTGYRNVRDFFGNISQQAVYDQFYSPSNSLVLQVKPLPAEKRPPHFSGLVGTGFTLDVSAAPVEVKVGDPITLQLSLGGGIYLKDAEIPPLRSRAELSSLFRIPADRSPGKFDGTRKIFTQTLRALSEDVTEIPSFSIPYFDTRTGEYRNLRTRPVRLEVAASEIKTFTDLEGIEGEESHNGIESRDEGIAHNYEGALVLRDRSANPGVLIGHPLYLLILFLPVIAYLGLFFITRFRHLLLGGKGEKQGKRAYTELIRALRQYSAGTENASRDVYREIGAKINEYLGARLKLKGGALTFSDVKAPLVSRGVSSSVLQSLEQVFAECEAGYYAGGAFSPQETSSFCRLAGEVVREIERSFTK